MPGALKKTATYLDLEPDEPDGCSELASLVGSRLADGAAIEGEADTS